MSEKEKKEAKDEKKVTFQSEIPTSIPDSTFSRKLEKTVWRWVWVYWPLLALLIIVILWQTKMLGYFGEEQVNLRLKAEAEAVISFGKVKSEVRKEGEGEKVAKDMWVTIRATGYRQDGAQFWSSAMGRDRTLTFQTGQPQQGKVIPGLDEPLIGLPVGTSVTLTVPPDLAFGERGKRSWRIRPWEVLTFDVVIVAVSDTDPKPTTEKKPNPAPSPAPEQDPTPKKAEEEPKKPDEPTSDLGRALASIGLQTWEGELRKQGLVSIDDFKYLEKEGDLPDTLPLFTRRKLVAHAKKLREEQSEQGVEKEKKEKRKEVGNEKEKQTCDAETCAA